MRPISLVLALALLACGGARCPEPVVAAAEPVAEAPPARRPAPEPNPPSGSVRVQVRHVRQASVSGFELMLEDPTSQRTLPIYIGASEAMVIDLRMRGEQFERPLTHDLLSGMLDRLDAEVLYVHVDKLESNIFVGSVVLWDGQQLQTFDSRTSDAVALALGHDAPIYVSPAVFAAAGH